MQNAFANNKRDLVKVPAIGWNKGAAGKIIPTVYIKMARGTSNRYIIHAYTSGVYTMQIMQIKERVLPHPGPLHFVEREQRTGLAWASGFIEFFLVVGW
jgi:hypothetical protein